MSPTQSSPPPRYEMGTYKGEPCVGERGRTGIFYVIAKCGTTQNAEKVLTALNTAADR